MKSAMAMHCRLLCFQKLFFLPKHVFISDDFKMTDTEELSQFLTIETRLDAKALALQHTLGKPL